ncbi:uncharacterized protein LOC135488628 [Lineus longissimus]|uniref:uncharacterized protein LOC135488628 n=1 Tax=Lineus longissimus TaxID=88925 RepID=UPI00315CACCE
MFGKPVQLLQTSTGHYCIKLVPHDAEASFVENQVLVTQNGSDLFQEQLIMEEEALKTEVMQVIELQDAQRQKAKLIKIHKQFGHASADRLQKLLISAGMKNPEIFQMLTDVVKECETCQMYRKVPPKPAVGLPLATDFNQTVAVDLHELDRNIWYLHIIDEFTRFSAGAIVKRKLPQVFVQEFLSHWISIFGPPTSLFSDNGGEFSNSETHDLCENFNIKVITTAAYAPFSNGLLEKHNHVLTNIMLKVKHDRNCSWETALKWALNAKNSMIKVHGFSAYQLVFGRNPNLPANLTNQLPALEGTTTSKVVGEHLGALYATRKAFTETECSERIRRALKKQTRSYTGDKYQMGDKVYYRRPDNTEWKGPGTVIGQDGKIVFIRHGGNLVRVHISRLQLVNQQRSHSAMTGDSSGHPTENKDNDRNRQDRSSKDEQPQKPATGDDDDQPPIQHGDDHPNQDQDQEEGAQGQNPGIRTDRIKVRQDIAFKHDEKEERMTAKVVSRAGKAGGKYKHWYNIQYLGGDSGSEAVDLEKVHGLELVDVEHEEQGRDPDEVMISQNVDFEEAKQKELSSWSNHQVYSEVQDQGQKCVSTRWVLTLKDTEAGIIPKARLVARGFEEHGANQTDSPTCGNDSWRIVMAVIAQRRWVVNSMDIKTAFLQGKSLERDIFVKPPKEANVSGKSLEAEKVRLWIE